MAIHVKELVIKANVGRDSAPGAVREEASEARQTEMIKAAVAEVMRMMKDKKNR